MGKWLLAASVALIGATLVINDADARRLGGGRSLGAQRNVTAPPAKQAQPQQAQPQQQAPQGNRWAGILGGLAIGGLLGYLFGGNGLVGLLLVALLAVGIGLALRAAMRRKEEARPVQLAGMGNETVSAQPLPQAALPAARNAALQVPAGFDMTGFLRTAKMQFIRLQAANDSGRMDEIREFTTPGMYEELRADAQPGQRTDVIALNADLLELAREKDNYWASVRFSGTVREEQGAEPVGFEEVWNLVKPADGSSGWLLAGIQQMH